MTWTERDLPVHVTFIRRQPSEPTHRFRKLNLGHVSNRVFAKLAILLIPGICLELREEPSYLYMAGCVEEHSAEADGIKK